MQMQQQQSSSNGNSENILMDRFLAHCELPVLGTSALEQILHQASLDFPPAMSPDSSQWTSNSTSTSASSASTSGVESGSESGHSSDLECLPDSTTREPRDDDNCSTNSDPINSSGSEYSFAASPPSFEPLLHEETHPSSYYSSGSSTSPASVAQKRCASSGVDEAPLKKRSRKSKAGPTELACPLCEYSTRVKEHLASHMNSHTSDRKYMCGQCGQTFKWSHSLRRHQRTHQKDYKFTCAHCPKTFSRKDHLAVHEKLHDSDNTDAYPCPECGVKFKNKKTLTGHVKTHSTDKPHKCDSCDSAFTRKASLTRHVLAAHAGHVFHCDICTAPFSYKSTLEDHRRAVHNEGKRDFHCAACGLSFACKAYLQKHMGVCKNREDKEEIPCNSCPRTFPTRRHLQEHRRSKHREEREEVLPTAPQNMGHSVGQYFSSVGRLPAPRPQLPPFSCAPPPPPRCEVCHAHFPTELALSRHFPTHWPSATSHQQAEMQQGGAKVTGNDLPLPLPHHHEQEHDNVGSLLRQVYHTEHTDFGAKLQPLGAEAYPMEYPSYDTFLYFNA